MRLEIVRAAVLLVLGVLPYAPASAEEDPKIAYWLHCAGCHRLDGTGAPPEVPTLIDEPGRIAERPGGREYLIRIPGVALAGLDDDRLAAVLNYMLAAFSPRTTPPDFAPYTAAEVARHRTDVLIDPLKARSDLVGD
jgi:mono/diheme cytochrome c family protein